MCRASFVLLVLASLAASAAPAPAPVPPAKAAAPRPTPEPVPKARPRGDEAKKSRPKLPAYLGMFGPPSFLQQVGLRSSPGRWFEFEGAGASGGPQRMRVAEVGPAPAGTRWIEVTSDLGEEQRLAFRMQFRGADAGNLERLVVKPPMMPVMEFPVDSYEVINRMADDSGHDHGTPNPAESTAGRVLPPDATTRSVGTEKVVTPAGSFECTHWILEAEGLRQDYWTTTDPKVPFTGVVKMVTERGTSLLVALGTDAKPTVVTPGARAR